MLEIYVDIESVYFVERGCEISKIRVDLSEDEVLYALSPFKI